MGSSTSSVRNWGAPDGNRVTGMTKRSPKLAVTVPTAIKIVASLCRSDHINAGMYKRCIQESNPVAAGFGPMLLGTSPWRRKIAPNTGTAVNATRVEPTKAKLTAMAKGKKKDPTNP